MSTFFSLVTELETLLEQLNVILTGDESTTVLIDGENKPSITKKTIDTVNDKVQLVLDAAADIDAVKYGAISSGLTNTVNGQYFSVVSSNGVSYLDLYENVSGVAQLRKTYPSLEALDDLRAFVVNKETIPFSSFDETRLTVSGSLSNPGDDRYNKTPALSVAEGQIVFMKGQAFGGYSPFEFRDVRNQKISGTGILVDGTYNIEVEVPKGAVYLVVIDATAGHENYTQHEFSIEIRNQKQYGKVELTYSDFLSYSSAGGFGNLSTYLTYSNFKIPVEGFNSINFGGVDATNRFYVEAINELSESLGSYRNTDLKRLPENTKYVHITAMNDSHDDFTASVVEGFYFKTGYSELLDLEGLKRDVEILINRNYVVFRLENFTEIADGYSIDYRRTLALDTSKFNYVYIRSQMRGIGLVARSFTQYGGEASNLVEIPFTNNRISFSHDIYEVPEDVAFIDVVSAIDTHPQFMPEAEPLVIFGKTKEDIYEVLAEILQSTNNVDFSVKGEHAYTGNSAYDSTKPIFFCPGMALEYRVEALNSSGVINYSNPVTSESLISTKDTISFKNMGYLQLSTYNDTHENYDSSFTPILDFNGTIVNGRTYPIKSTYLPTVTLKTVREVSFTDGTNKQVMNYLWQDSEYNFYISETKHGERKFAFSYDIEVFHGQEPHWFSMGFDSRGNIICVYRTEGLPTSNPSDDVRLNPIVLVKSNNYAPVVVDVKSSLEGISPSGWLQNCGFECLEDSIMFTEYTRPSVETTNTWKVYHPVTEAANWVRVQTFNVHPSGQEIKHLHNVERDPHTGFIYTTRGDDDIGAAIYVSKDNGSTFELVLSGSEKYCRVLNLVWLKDSIYWATDSGGARHYAFKATRNSEGVLDVNSIQDLHLFPYASRPTYASIYMPAINAIVFLGREDGTGNNLPIDLLDLNDDSFHTIDTLTSVGGGNMRFGFRCECFEYIPRGTDFICGFSYSLASGGYINNIGLLGNTLDNNYKVNNLKVTVNRLPSGFTIDYETVS